MILPLSFNASADDETRYIAGFYIATIRDFPQHTCYSSPFCPDIQNNPFSARTRDVALFPLVLHLQNGFVMSYGANGENEVMNY